MEYKQFVSASPATIFKHSIENRPEMERVIEAMGFKLPAANSAVVFADCQTGDHAGEWRQRRVYCCSLVGNLDGKLCVHSGGRNVIQGQHWSCCGQTEKGVCLNGHEGEWRQTRKYYCSVLPRHMDGRACTHGDGIESAPHWSCCGSKIWLTLSREQGFVVRKYDAWLKPNSKEVSSSTSVHDVDDKPLLSASVDVFVENLVLDVSSASQTVSFVEQMRIKFAENTKFVDESDMMSCNDILLILANLNVKSVGETSGSNDLGGALIDTEIVQEQVCICYVSF